MMIPSNKNKNQLSRLEKLQVLKFQTMLKYLSIQPVMKFLNRLLLSKYSIKVIFKV